MSYSRECLDGGDVIRPGEALQDGPGRDQLSIDERGAAFHWRSRRLRFAPLALAVLAANALAIAALVTALCALSGCSSGTSAPCGGTTVQGRHTWSAPSDRPECVELAADLEKLTFSDVLVLDADQCTATAYVKDEFGQLSALCDVSPDGAADCEVSVEANDTSCELTLTILP